MIRQHRSILNSLTYIFESFSFEMLKSLILRILLLSQAFCHLTDENDESEILAGGCKYEAFKFKFRNDNSCDKLRFGQFQVFKFKNHFKWSIYQKFSDWQSMSIFKILIPNFK